MFEPLDVMVLTAKADGFNFTYVVLGTPHLRSYSISRPEKTEEFVLVVEQRLVPGFEIRSPWRVDNHRKTDQLLKPGKDYTIQRSKLSIEQAMTHPCQEVRDLGLKLMKEQV